METIRIRKIVGIFASAALASGVVLTLATTTPVQTAHALPIYAQETGLPCGRCHVSPYGGGPRTAFGRAFAANGDRLPSGDRYAHHSARRRGYSGDDYARHGGMMERYGPHGGNGSGMMGGYGTGPGMMGW